MNSHHEAHFRVFFLLSQHVPKYLLRASEPAQVSAPHHGNMSSVSVGKLPAATSHGSGTLLLLCCSTAVILCRRHEDPEKKEARNLSLNSWKK